MTVATPEKSLPPVPATPLDDIAVVLMNMGGPDDQDSVKPFLTNLFSDPDIIRLPASWLLQKPLAKLIVAKRGDEAKANYAKMAGGGSPQRPITEAQANALQAALAEAGLPLPVTLAMRYWHPFTDDMLAKLWAQGKRRLVLVSLYPHFSYTTFGSNLNALRRAAKQQNISPEYTVVGGYATHPDYIAAMVATVHEALEKHTWSCAQHDVQVMFSAHSLPVQHVTRTKDPYPQLIQKCADAIMSHFPGIQWDIGYQSKVGNIPWLSPGTDGVLHYYAGLNKQNVLMIPISFVSDHIETLVEIDIDYVELAHELGIPNCYRTAVMNTRPDYIAFLRDRVIEKLHLRGWLHAQP